MIKGKVLKELLGAVKKGLPSDLTEDQALYWVKNPRRLTDALKDLSKVIVVSKQSQK